MSNIVFNHEHFNELSEDPYYRFLKNSPKVGYAIISNQDIGQDTGQDSEVTQFSLNKPTNSSIRPLCNVEKASKFGTTYYKAKTPNGTLMSGKRFISISFEQGKDIYNAKIVCFSPIQKKDFIGSNKEIKIRNKKSNSKICDREKGGQYLEINTSDIAIRTDTSRPKTQNQVMGKSACDEYSEYQDMYEDELTTDANKQITESVEAPFNNLFYSQKRPEWLHAYSYSLTPLKYDPQIAENLGAGPKWANTAMMIPERAARWFATNHSDSKVKIKPNFKMIRDFDVIRKINYELLVTKGTRRLKILQTILPFARFPLYNKASDIAGITFLASSLMEMRRPSHISKLKIAASSTSSSSSSSSSSSKQDDTDNPRPNKKRKFKNKKSLSFFDNFNSQNISRNTKQLNLQRDI
jgi:large subunit ribosomal protein L28